MIEKLFYSCLDPYVIAPQAEQHQLISMMARSLEGKVVFYGAEDYFVAATQPFILPKLRRTPGLSGVIFFTIDQFAYSDDLNVKLLHDILELGLIVGFSRENYVCYTPECLDKNFLELKAYIHCKKSRAADILN